MRMLVLGAGLQGSACAYDLLQNPDVTEVRLADLNVDRLAPFLTPYIGQRLVPTVLDVRDRERVGEQMRQCKVVMSAIPYYFNESLAQTAIESGAHFCDLGGNTQIVFNQKQLDEKAKAQGVSVIPDCGVAPGMVNILAQHGIEQFDAVDEVRIYVGGLPQFPEPPLNYQVVYSLEGVLDYYTTLSWVLRDGKRTQVKPLSEVEAVPFPGPLGTLEAFHTAGGLSTMAGRYVGTIPTMEYKTLRYPGHAHIMEAIRDLGLLDATPIEVKQQHVSPRDVAVAVMGPRLRSDKPDVLALRVTVRGTRGGTPGTVSWQVVDRFDASTGISAMMRTTGFSLAITGLFQGRGLIKPGVLTPDESMPAEPYISELRARGIDVVETRS
jgi:lysine 6-dehydrogenase